MSEFRCVSAGRRMLPLLVIFSVLWLLLTNANGASWIIGAPVVLAAAIAVVWLRTSRNTYFSFAGLLRFVPLFVYESLRSGLDVAYRLLTPRMRIHPGFVVYTHKLRDTSASVLFVNCVSLLPGTLAADVDGARLTVHMLDDRSDPGEELQRLERAVARIYPDSRPGTLL